MRAAIIFSYLIPAILVPVIGFLSGGRNARNNSWYDSLNKSPASPPDIAFGIVWGILYILVGISIGRIIHLGIEGPLSPLLSGLVVCVSLVTILLFVWPSVFFSNQSAIGGIAILSILLALSFGSIVISSLTSQYAILVPFVLLTMWLIYATYLNGYIIASN